MDPERLRMDVLTVWNEESMKTDKERDSETIHIWLLLEEIRKLLSQFQIGVPLDCFVLFLVFNKHKPNTTTVLIDNNYVRLLSMTKERNYFIGMHNWR